MENKYYITIMVILFVILSVVFIETSKPKRMTDDFVRSDDGKYAKAPELKNIDGWINSEPLTMGELKGKVVVIDFWTYSCINCIRTIPYLNSWYDKYEKDGLVIIGVHTPEFDFEKDYDNVKMATEKYGIKFPVALDNEYGTWGAYSNNYWPRKYLIDKDGYIRFDHIGEGGYEETEEKIQELLKEKGVIITDNLSNIEDQTPTTPNTPELYLGYASALPRGQNIGNPGGIVPGVERNFTINPDAGSYPNIVFLNGHWKSESESFVTSDNDAVLQLTFKAKKAHIVLDVSGIYSNKVYVTIDDIPVNTEDVKDGYMTLDNSRLYTVYDGDYGTYKLKIYFNNSNVHVNSFTFG